MAHVRAPMLRWGVLAALAAVWIVAGYIGLRTNPAADGIELDALYKTFGAIGVQDYLSPSKNQAAEIARFAGLAVPVVGLAFAFSGQLGSSLAQFFHVGSAGHVVVAGGGQAALALARDCAAHGDVVVVVADDLSDETSWGLRKDGVILVNGDPSLTDALRSARAATAAHVVALDADDPRNLRIEAAVQTLARKRRRPPAVHVGLKSSMLLQEAREMRAMDQRRREAEADGKTPRGPDARPFSLDELAARELMVRAAPLILDGAARRAAPRPHVVMFGFDSAAEMVAVRALLTLWSAKFEPPRVTVATPDPGASARRFDARYPQARAHAVQKADIDFIAFDWDQRPLDETVLREIEQARGPVAAAVVSTGDDGSTITVALALLRAANYGPIWPVPIFMKESQVSEFSKLYASGDAAGADRAYLQAFGACEDVAVRRLVIESALDVGAGVAHQMYQKGVSARGAHDRDLEAMRRSYEDVPETYRAANRAAADHALVKLWDMGLSVERRAHGSSGAGAAPPAAVPADMHDRLARVEHSRWMAERLMSGWRPGDTRDNAKRVHPNLVPWENLTDGDKAKDKDQVEAAMLIARVSSPKGGARRPKSPRA